VGGGDHSGASADKPAGTSDAGVSGCFRCGSFIGGTRRNHATSTRQLVNRASRSSAAVARAFAVPAHPQQYAGACLQTKGNKRALTVTGRANLSRNGNPLRCLPVAGFSLRRTCAGVSVRESREKSRVPHSRPKPMACPPVATLAPTKQKKAS